jgi:hypothetical protein
MDETSVHFLFVVESVNILERPQLVLLSPVTIVNFIKELQLYVYAVES